MVLYCCSFQETTRPPATDQCASLGRSSPHTIAINSSIEPIHSISPYPSRSKSKWPQRQQQLVTVTTTTYQSTGLHWTSIAIWRRSNRVNLLVGRRFNWSPAQYSQATRGGKRIFIAIWWMVGTGKVKDLSALICCPLVRPSVSHWSWSIYLT